MKLGFYANANNYPFMLARAVRALGHDVTFLVTSDVPLDRPENRYDDVPVPYPPWIHDVSPLVPWHYPGGDPLRRSRAIDLLRRCDGVILNGPGPALASEIGRPAIALLTGWDLPMLSDFRTLDFFLWDSYRFRHWSDRLKPRLLYGRLVLRRFQRRFIAEQRRGIRTALAVSFFRRGLVPHGDDLLDEIGVRPEQRIFLFMTDTEYIRPRPLPSNGTPRLFCVARLTWVRPKKLLGETQLGYKGTDVMIRGLSLLAKRGRLFELRLVRKGVDIAATEALVEQSGLKPYVTWLSEMSQREVLEEYEHADVVLDHFGEGMVGMGALDALAMGRPVVANARPDVCESAFGRPLPVCQASTPEEVCGQVERLILARSERERISSESRQAVERHFSAAASARLCLDLFSRANGLGVSTRAACTS